MWCSLETRFNLQILFRLATLGSMRNIFEIKLPLDQIIWNGCRSLLKISRGNWSRNYTKKNSNSSMLPWETIISPNNFPAQSIVFPKQEAVNFFYFFFIFFLPFQIPTQSEDTETKLNASSMMKFLSRFQSCLLCLYKGFISCVL